MSGWWAAGAQRWRARFVRFSQAEVVIGAAIVAAWSMVGIGVTFANPVLGAVAAVVGVVLHLSATETGSHALALLTTTLVALLVIVALSAPDTAVSPLLFTLAGVSALAHSDLLRISYGRRRRARLDPAPVRNALGGTALAGVMALAGIGIAMILGDDPGRSWLWMPAAVAAVTAVSLALTVLPVRRAPEPSRVRWRPGDRMPPPIQPDLDPLTDQSGSWFQDPEPRV